MGKTHFFFLEYGSYEVLVYLSVIVNYLSINNLNFLIRRNYTPCLIFICLFTSNIQASDVVCFCCRVDLHGRVCSKRKEVSRNTTHTEPYSHIPPVCWERRYTYRNPLKDTGLVGGIL